MEATPWHHDFAGSDEPGSTSRRVTRHAAVWLALKSTGPRSGCMRFAPSLGFEHMPHQTLPRAEAPSGFETHMVHTEAAEAAAEDCPLEPGMAVVIGDQVPRVSSLRPCLRGLNPHFRLPWRRASTVHASPCHELSI